MAEEYYAPVHLRVEPQAIPRLRAALDKALARLEKPVSDLGQVGHIHGAWMGDPKSAEVAAHYNANVMDAPDGQYQALLRYQEELRRIRDQLTLLGRLYQQTDDDVGATFAGGAV